MRKSHIGPNDALWHKIEESAYVHLSSTELQRCLLYIAVSTIAFWSAKSSGNWHLHISLNHRCPQGSERCAEDIAIISVVAFAPVHRIIQDDILQVLHGHQWTVTNHKNLPKALPVEMRPVLVPTLLCLRVRFQLQDSLL